MVAGQSNQGVRAAQAPRCAGNHLIAGHWMCIRSVVLVLSTSVFLLMFCRRSMECGPPQTPQEPLVTKVRPFGRRCGGGYLNHFVCPWGCERGNVPTWTVVLEYSSGSTAAAVSARAIAVLRERTARNRSNTAKAGAVGQNLKNAQ